MKARRVILSGLGVVLAAGVVAGRGTIVAAAELLKGEAAIGDWRLDAPGVRRKLSAGDLPPPLAAPLAASRSEVAERPSGALPRAPEGFSVDVFASGLKGPRALRRAPNGDVFVAESSGGRISVLRAEKGASGAARTSVFASGLDRPYGVAFYPPGPEPKYIYVSTPTRVLRYPYRNGDLAASGDAQVVIDNLPGGGHWTRDLAFSPDGKTLFVAVGSRSNVAEGQSASGGAEVAAAEAASHVVGLSAGSEFERADVLAFDPDGGGRRVFAAGLRNCSGVTIEPRSGDLWCVVNERDMLGDDLPFDYATRVRQGQFYGWPWYYIGAHADPRHAGARPDLAEKVATPDVLIQAHSAPLGIAFYDADQFPANYRGDAFVTLHGSWNRAKRTGYKVVRLIFENGKPTGEYEDFLVGFVLDDQRVWGRPVGVTVAADGSLLISEDANGTIWRVSHGQK